MDSYGWPPRLLMRLAVQYTGRSRWTLARAVRNGELAIAGYNGRSPVFDRDVLDEWMLGDGAPQPPRNAPMRTRRAASPRDRLRALRAEARHGGSQ